MEVQKVVKSNGSTEFRTQFGRGKSAVLWRGGDFFYLTFYDNRTKYKANKIFFGMDEMMELIQVFNAMESFKTQFGEIEEPCPQTHAHTMNQPAHQYVNPPAHVGQYVNPPAHVSQYVNPPAHIYMPKTEPVSPVRTEMVQQRPQSGYRAINSTVTQPLHDVQPIPVLGTKSSNINSTTEVPAKKRVKFSVDTNPSHDVLNMIEMDQALENIPPELFEEEFFM